MSNRTEATLRKHRQPPPGDYSHCACSRLYSESVNKGRLLAPIHIHEYSSNRAA
jgi:hypothetical protein